MEIPDYVVHCHERRWGNDFADQGKGTEDWQNIGNPWRNPALDAAFREILLCTSGCIRTGTGNGRSCIRTRGSVGEPSSGGSFQIAPTEDYLLFTLVQKGPEEKKEIYEFIDPDDRQPGWRNRTYLARFDVKTGVVPAFDLRLQECMG